MISPEVSQRDFVPPPSPLCGCSSITQVALVTIALIAVGFTIASFVQGWAIPVASTSFPAGVIPIAVFLLAAGAFLCLRIHKSPAKPQPRPPIHYENLYRGDAQRAWSELLNAPFPSNRSWVDASGDQLTPLNPGNAPGLNDIRLPHIFNYRRGGWLEPHLFVVKLPRAHLAQFPREIQDQLNRVPNVDLYLIVYRHITSTTDIRKRNLAFHTVVFPDADEGFDHYSFHNMGIFELVGIETGRGEYDLQPDRWESHCVYVHPVSRGTDERGAPIYRQAISPNTASFYFPADPPPTSSFFSACQIDRTHGVATLSIFINDGRSDAGQAFRNAASATTLGGYWNTLQESDAVDPTTLEQIRRVIQPQRGSA